ARPARKRRRGGAVRAAAPSGRPGGPSPRPAPGWLGAPPGAPRPHRAPWRAGTRSAAAACAAEAPPLLGEDDQGRLDVAVGEDLDLLPGPRPAPAVLLLDGHVRLAAEGRRAAEPLRGPGARGPGAAGRDLVHRDPRGRGPVAHVRGQGGRRPGSDP